MFRSLCSAFVQNKNSLMLVTTSIYILALFSVLSKSLMLISLCLMMFFIFCVWKDVFKPKYIFIWIFVFCFGVINTSVRLRDADELLSLAPLNSKITGTIISIPQGSSEGKVKFYLDVDKINFQGVEKEFKNEKVLVTYEYPQDLKLKLYDYYEFDGRLSIPFKAGNPSQFDYGNYLRNYDAYSVFYAKSHLKLVKDLSLKQKFLQNVNDYRERILDIHSQYLKSPNLEILGGIVFGDDAVSPPKDIKQSFVNSGLLHILAASGMNVAFIFTFFFCLLSIFRVPYKLRICIGMLTVLLYCLMTGMGASVIRATTMLIFVLVGKLIDRDAHSISLLSFVALLMLIYNPLFINDVGFQLSFIVTFGILVMSPALIRAKEKFLNSVLGVVLIPIIAQLWVIPIQIFYFNNISLYSVFANIMSVPILMVISFGGFMSSLISIITPIAHFVCKSVDYIMTPLINLLVNISDFWGYLPHSTIQTSHPMILQILLYYAILLTLTALLNFEIRKKYLKTLKKALFIFVVVFLFTLVPFKSSEIEITVFDVGNADCILVKSAKNHYTMIDTGKAGYKGGKSQAEFVILKYLKDRGIKSLDNLIVTHFDNDHCGGAIDLMKNLKIKNLYINDKKHPSIVAKNIIKTAEDNKINIKQAINSQVVYDNNGVILTNFIPKINSTNDNENSIITLFKFNDFSMLFTGDVGAQSLNSIINQLPQNISVLKVPHHGARGSLDNQSVSHLSPKVVIISVGENKFGHPAEQVLQLLNNSIVLRTDMDNSIKINVNKKGFKIYSYDINSKKYVKLSH